MIKVEKVSAVLTKSPGFAEDVFCTVSRLKAERTISPAGLYALKAVEPIKEYLGHCPILSFSGHPGVSVSVFEKARSGEGPLLYPGFDRRSRRIHPFTLLTSLFNSVPAAVSTEFNNQAPSINQFEISPFQHFFPLLQGWFAAFQRALILFSSAATREEEWDRRSLADSEPSPIEGAVALLVSGEGGGSQLSYAENELDFVCTPFRVSQALDLGLALLWVMSSVQVPSNVRFPARLESCFKWSPI